MVFRFVRISGLAKSRRGLLHVISTSYVTLQSRKTNRYIFGSFPAMTGPVVVESNNQDNDLVRQRFVVHML